MKGTTKMKKTRIVVGVLALAVVAAIVIACTKENETTVDQSSNQMTTVSKEDDMSAYLKHFKEKMQSAEKGDETLSLEDARWHLEAVLNYTYGDADYQTSEIQRDTFYCKMPNQGEEISFVQLNEVFGLFSNSIEEAYAECDLPGKSILAIQTRLKTDSKDGDLIIQTILSTRGHSTMPNPYSFDSTDYWSEYYYDDGYGYISGGGKCGPYAGQCMNSGAPNELTKKANLRIPHYGCGNGYRLYFTDVEYEVSMHGTEDVFLDDPNSPCGYKIYVNPLDPENPYHNPTYCIPPEDMNYYISVFPEILEHYKPEGMVAIEAQYYHDILTSIPGAVEFLLYIKYGICHCVPVLEDE